MTIRFQSNADLIASGGSTILAAHQQIDYFSITHDRIEGSKAYDVTNAYGSDHSMFSALTFGVPVSGGRVESL